jgi:hypothetical protein
MSNVIIGRFGPIHNGISNHEQLGRPQAKVVDITPRLREKKHEAQLELYNAPPDDSEKYYFEAIELAKSETLNYVANSCIKRELTNAYIVGTHKEWVEGKAAQWRAGENNQALQKAAKDKKSLLSMVFVMENGYLDELAELNLSRLSVLAGSIDILISPIAKLILTSNTHLSDYEKWRNEISRSFTSEDILESDLPSEKKYYSDIAWRRYDAGVVGLIMNKYANEKLGFELSKYQTQIRAHHLPPLLLQNSLFSDPDSWDLVAESLAQSTPYNEEALEEAEKTFI